MRFEMAVWADVSPLAAGGTDRARRKGGRGGRGEVKIAAAAALWVRCAGPQTSFHLSRTPVRPCKTLTDQRPLLDANVQLFFSASVHLLHARLISNRGDAIHANPYHMILYMYTVYGIFVNPSTAIFF